MLYYPFQCFTDLLSFDRYSYRSYIDAFQACGRLYTHLDDFYTDRGADNQDTDSKDDELVRNESDAEHLADFELFARRQRRTDDLTCSFTDDLGSRDLDHAYNWMSHIGRDITTAEAWDQFKLLNHMEQAVTIDSDLGSLNTE